ncbi:integrase catalytic domain-containing protein [Trichonephila clavipes]|nr:integrase catalytic domain-containing protein [Trichonephila clavipes]
MQEKYSKTIQFYEENKILKVRSRLILGEDTEDFVRPTILPDHPIVRRLIEYTHKTLQHAGVPTTLSHLRERFWILRGRRIVREVLHKCLTCKRYSSKPLVPDGSAPLPVDRINSVAYFESTEAFMQALRRFFARGRSSIMYTDNGTNFVGTLRALNTLNWPEIVAECGIQKIKWNFNPSSAPWYGGWWERIIRTIKQLLRKVVGRTCATYVEMETLLCECESIVNGRTLTYIYDDPNELRVIKPSDFIQDIKGNETVDLDIVDARHLQKHIRYLQNLRFQLHNTKRLSWSLGQVIKLFKGKDNIKRVVKLCVENGEIIRPIQGTYPLEIDSAEFTKSVPENIESATETIDDIDHEHIPPEEQSETLHIEQSQSGKKTRFDRRIVPVKRLDL